MTNFEYYKTLTIGVIIGASTVILAFYMFKPEPQPDAPKSNFKVMDTYKNCDVIRWTQSNFAEYKYFLHCPK